MEDEVFIILNTHAKSPWQVEIRGDEKEKVDRGVEHYQNMTRKAQIRRMASSPAIVIFLDESEGSDVVLLKSETWWPGPKQVIAQMTDNGSLDKGFFRDETLNRSKLLEVERAIRFSLDAARVEQGSYKLSLRFGCFYLLRLQNAKLNQKLRLADFKRAIENKVPLKTCNW